jgi:hypothetical protein
MRSPVTAAVSYARIELRYPGVYRVTGKQIEEAGANLSSIKPTRLTLWNEGQVIPLRVSAASAAAFTAADSIEFVASEALGTIIHFKPYNLHNVYLLTWGERQAAAGAEPIHYKDETLTAPTNAKPVSVRQMDLLEEDFLYRHSALPPGQSDGFQWAPFRPDTWPGQKVFVDFPGFDSKSSSTVNLTARFIGATVAYNVKPNHLFNAYYGSFPKADVPLGTFQFDGMGYYDFATSIPMEKLIPDSSNVPGAFQMKAPEDRKDVIDEVFLEHFHTEYPRHLDATGLDWSAFGDEAVSASLVARGDTSGPLLAELRGLPAGGRVFAPELARTFSAATTASLAITVPLRTTGARDTATSLVAVAPAGFMAPDSITVKQPTAARLAVTSDTQILILHHSDTARAADFLARYRRWQGSVVANVNVIDIYDTLNNGFIGDVAVKRFIRHAAEAAPGLRYVVLLGTSSFDYREARNRTDDEQRHILIPIHWIVNPATTWTGGYPDDNWYTSFYGANTPEIAIGRIPANDDHEGFAYLRKVVEYEQLGRARDGKLLLVSSVEKSFQNLTGEMGTLAGDRFTTVTSLYPETTVATHEIARLSDAINSGLQVLYYVGHGGNLVWRVGPSDFKQQKDLFTPDDVKGLANKGHYPIIHASSCYTTSFDAPGGIGASFVLEPDRGAIAVIGTPWKATVYEGHEFNRAFFKAYLDTTNHRLGDAFVEAKQELRPKNPMQVDFQDFTLLGDPTLLLTRREMNQ